METGQIVERNGKRFLVVGKTFSTSEEMSDGDSFLLEGEQVNLEKDADGNVKRLTVWVPTFIEKTDGSPDRIDSIAKRARDHGVLQEKVIRDNEIEYLPTESGNENTASKESFNPPKAVVEAAKLGLELRRQFNRGGTEVGVARARDLSNSRNVSEDTIKRMRSYFARHAVDAQAEGWENRNDPSPGWIAWLLWGGDPGKEWSERIYKQEIDTKSRQTNTDEYPDEDNSLKFVFQEHFRGKSAHGDFRAEYKRGDSHFLKGFTIANQQPEAIRKPIETIDEANKAVADDSNWKQDLETGIIKERETRAGITRRGSLQAFPKAAEIPADWLTVQGVTKEPDPGEPIPAGATREYPGVFKIIQKGTVDWGARKPWIEEYFIDGDDGWKGRWLFRLVQRDQKEILPPGKQEENARTESYWILMQPEDQTPYVLGKEAVDEDWLPPKGISALPKRIRDKVPEDLRYWNMDTTDALEARKKLSEFEEIGGTELKQKSGEFVLAKRTWKGQTVIRFGPSTTVYDLYVKNGNTQHFELQESPVEKDVAIIPVESKAFSEKVFSMNIGDKEDLPPNTKMNPTKDTPATMEIIDKGSVLILTDEDTHKKYSFEGNELTKTYFLKAEDENNPEGFWMMSKLEGPKTKELEDNMEQNEKAKWSTAYIDKLPDSAFLYIADGLRRLPYKDAEGNIDLPHLRDAIARASEIKDKEGNPLSNVVIEDIQNRARAILKKAETEKEVVGVQTERDIVQQTSSGVDAQVKEGKRLRGDKVGLLRRIQEEFAQAFNALKDFINWSSYEQGDGYEYPTPSEEFVEEFALQDWLGEKLLSGDEFGGIAFKAKDGKAWWLQFTTNAFQDREGEIFTTKAIEDYVDRKEKEDTKGEFWFWHIPGTKFGTVKWQAMSGRFLAQAGPFDDTKIGNAFKEFFLKYPQSHPEIAPEGWGTSHGYRFKSKDRDDRIYDWFDIMESTVLPANIASNPYNPIPKIIEEVKEMNDTQRKALEAIGGAELVGLVEKVGQERTKELEDVGVQFKAKSSYGDKIRKVAAKIKDEMLQKELNDLAKMMEDDYPYPAPAKKENESEDDKMSKMEKACTKLEELANKATETEKDELMKIAAEMRDGMGKKEITDEQPTQTKTEEVKSTETNTEPTKQETQNEDTSDKAVEELREEVSEALKAVVGRFNQFDESLKQIANMLAPLAQKIDELEKSDGERVQELLSQTPAASRKSLVEVLFGDNPAEVRSGSKLANSGPVESQPKAVKSTGVPLIDQFISEVDQNR